MKRVMFDLETLSTFPNAAMIAVAVVIRDDSNPAHRQARSWFIHPDFVVGNQNPETLEWWNSQDPRVRDVVFGGNQTPGEVLVELNGFLQSNGINSDRTDDVRCYASPAMFDFPILRHQYQQLGIIPAWSWRTERCLSTLMKEIRDHFGVDLNVDVQTEFKHHPVHDCLGQFQELDACLDILHASSKVVDARG